MDQVLNITPSGDTLTVLTGKALEPMLKDRRHFKASVHSAVAYLVHRLPKLDLSTALVQVDLNENRIVVIENIDDQLSHTMNGELKFSSDMVAFMSMLNTSMSLNDFRRLLKNNKRLFANVEDFNAISTAVMKFNASIKTNLTNVNDARGNKNTGVVITTQHGLPESL
jgi:hypothetical protein